MAGRTSQAVVGYIGTDVDRVERVGRQIDGGTGLGRLNILSTG
jgi:hypothetical protein